MSYSMSLNLQQKQSLKQSQRMIMSPQMQQAIHLLQMPVMELATMIDAELQQNPVLEYSQEPDRDDDDARQLEQEPSEDREESVEAEVTFDDNDFEVLKRLDEDYRDHFAESGGYQAKRTQEEEKLKTFLETAVRADTSLFEHLMQQAHESFEAPEELAVAELIAGSLDDSGFLTTLPEEIALLNGFEEALVRVVLEEVQTFEPAGIAANNLQDSLLLQLRQRGKEGSLAYQIVERHYDDLLHNRIPLIQKSLDCSAQEVRQAIDDDIIGLDLHPAQGYARQVVQSITPDAVVIEEDEQLKVVVNDDSMPGLRVNRRYLRMLDDESLPAETKEYIKQKVMSGKWLLRNIHQRNDTIFRITESLIKTQKLFFMQPEGQLVPLTMKSIAEELGLHESTIARAVANKYIDSPRGVLPLRSFFTNAYVTEEGKDISSSTVKGALLEIIKNEDKRKPLSDEALSKELKARGIPCARRTVAKYRTQFGLGNTSQRRSYG